MVLDLIEIKQKKLNIKKVIIAIIIILVLIGFSVMKIINMEKEIIAKNNQNEIRCISKQLAYIHQVKFKPTIKQTQNIIEQINAIYTSDEKRVFLTFDDGPSRTVTPLLLDLLNKEEIKVTFFLLGSRVEFNPDLVKREYEEGHYVANHGYSHLYSKIYESPQSVLDEYYATEQAIKNAIGNQEYNSYLFRFPGGVPGGKSHQLKLEAKDLLEQNGIAHIDWNALTGDAEGKNTVEDMLQYAKDTIGEKNSVVILMHDASDKILTYEMLPQLINYLRERGYNFKNMYDLIN